MTSAGLRTGYASDLINVFHDIFATGFKIGNEWYTVRNVLEIVNSQLNADRMCNCNQMKDCIGGTTENHSQNLYRISL